MTALGLTRGVEAEAEGLTVGICSHGGWGESLFSL